MSKERVTSWSHIYLITYDKTLTEKLLAVRPEKVTRKKKRIKRTREAIAKLFALNANAVAFQILLYLRSKQFSGFTILQLIIDVFQIFRTNFLSRFF